MNDAVNVAETLSLNESPYEKVGKSPSALM